MQVWAGFTFEYVFLYTRKNEVSLTYAVISFLLI